MRSLQHYKAMSLIVKMKLEDVYDVVCSKKFIHKLYLTADKQSIKKHNNGELIYFSRTYNYTDLHKIDGIAVPENLMSFIETNLQSIQITMDTEHKIIKHNDNGFIVKYTSILKKPEYVYSILKDTKIILYVQYTRNTNDPNMTVVHFNKKLLNANDEDDDCCIVDAGNDDVITHIYQQDTLEINPSLISISETFLGHNFVHDIVIPVINNIFNTSFSILQDVYTLRMIKYMSKKGIDIYKKK